MPGSRQVSQLNQDAAERSRSVSLKIMAQVKREIDESDLRSNLG